MSYIKNVLCFIIMLSCSNSKGFAELQQENLSTKILTATSPHPLNKRTEITLKGILVPTSDGAAYIHTSQLGRLSADPLYPRPNIGEKVEKVKSLP